MHRFPILRRNEADDSIGLAEIVPLAFQKLSGSVTGPAFNEEQVDAVVLTTYTCLKFGSFDPAFQSRHCSYPFFPIRSSSALSRRSSSSVSRAFRFISITDAATAASSGESSPSAICVMIADIAAVMSAGVFIEGNAREIGRPLRTG